MVEEKCTFVFLHQTTLKVILIFQKNQNQILFYLHHRLDIALEEKGIGYKFSNIYATHHSVKQRQALLEHHGTSVADFLKQYQKKSEEN